MLRILTILCVLIVASHCTKLNETDDVLMLIKQAGYRGSAYQVPTEDNGWLLKVHRIFPRRKVSGSIPVFLMHGLFVGSFDYIMTGSRKSLGYLLSDNNFDVFLGNARGNRHATVDPNRANYSSLWKFSFNEIGNYDLPAMIDYVLALTNATKLFYVGHSQGTTSLMALLSSRPEYNSKIIQAHLFAPVAFCKYIPNEWIKASMVPLLELLDERSVEIFNFTKIFTAVSPLTRIFCDYRISPGTTEICKAVIFSITGNNVEREELDQDILPTLVEHISWTLSFQQVYHFLQMLKSGKFQKYDYMYQNKLIYGAQEPPEYDLSKITAPIYIYRGTEDALSSRADVERLIKLLPNVKHNRVIPNYNHVDFNYGKRSRKLIYNDIVKFFLSEEASKV